VGAAPDSWSLREVLVTEPDRPVVLPGGKSVNPGETARQSYDRILELQRVPRLDEMLKMHASLSALAGGTGDPRAAAATIVAVSKAFKDVLVSPASAKSPALKELVKLSDPARFSSVSARLEKEAAGKKLSKDLPKFASEYWDLLAFRTVNALAGQVYAARFRAEDLLVAQDPYFLRKHQFAAAGPARHDYFPVGELHVSSEGAGSFAIGGFDGLSPVTGAAAAASLKNVDTSASFVATALLGSIRTTDWARLTQKALRSTAVQIHAGQDWLVLAAADEGLRAAVADASYGLLSLNRRARLLLALARRDWESVWSSTSLTDTFFLAARLREAGVRQGERSPAIAEYLASKEVIADGAGLLGPTLLHLRGYAVPAMVPLAPYEDTAAELFPDYLSERLAEFKLYLACLFSSQALPAAAMPAFAEAAAREVLTDIQMSSLRDWQAVISAYSEFGAERLREVMGNQ